MTTCPICDGANLATVFEVSADEAAQHWIIDRFEPARHRALSTHIRKLWERDEARVAECADCAFTFADPYVAGDAAFYKLAFEASGYPSEKWDFAQTRAALQRLDLTGATALEIGAGYGMFVRQIVPRFFAAERVTATEYNEVAIGKLKALGVNVPPLDIEELAAQGATFSTIFMFQVLEHRDRIHQVFGALARMLEPGGNLFIAVPNPVSTRFNEANNSLMDMPPNHIGRWQFTNFERMAAAHGLRVEQTALEPFSLAQFIRTDLAYSYIRRAQRGSAIAGYLYSRRGGRLGRLANLLAILAFAPSRFAVWWRAAKGADRLGGSAWVHLVRPVVRPDPA